MHSFTDAEGRNWTIRIRVSDLRRVKDLGYDLAAWLDDAALAARLADPCTLAGVLYALIAPQAAAGTGIFHVTPEQLADALDGPALAAASEALWEELSDFFLPSLPAVGGLIARALAAREEARAEAERKEAETAADAASGSESTGSQGPAGPTPAPSHSGN